ncbi:hypothetical protein KR018_003760 [Drosophila ironensis]|nr:hypothetical protein KR018_003760 [Drosophila ironensis]
MSCPGFGELNLPSSRAFWDDCDEDEFESVMPADKLKLTFEEEWAAKDDAVESELLVIVEGLHIAHFGASMLVKDSQRVCAIPSKSSSLHWNAASKQLVAIVEEDLTSSGEVTELLLPFAKLAKNVVTLTLKPKVEFKSEEIQLYREAIAVVRSVGGKHDDIVELEAPNFIAGVAAGVASWRDQNELPVSAFVVYIDKVPLDARAAQPVLKLLQAVGVACGTSYVPPRKDNSYLYM